MGEELYVDCSGSISSLHYSPYAYTISALDIEEINSSFESKSKTEIKTETTVEVEEEMSEDDLREAFTPKKIYYNNPVTVVFWSDNTKTIVRLHKGEKYNEYTAFTAALAKKIFGNNTRINKIVASGIKPKKKK